MTDMVVKNQKHGTCFSYKWKKGIIKQPHVYCLHVKAACMNSVQLSHVNIMEAEFENLQILWNIA